MESAINVAGILSCTSSNAVNLEPWLYGRVSVQKACLSSPCLCRDRMTPRAVPYPAVARDLAYQSWWLTMLELAGKPGVAVC